ncbi:MAG: HNH endonuclease [Armatimonadetes bacterium]|nr:HNH endonuclease [Armatimonadota bacterium]
MSENSPKTRGGSKPKPLALRFARMAPPSGGPDDCWEWTRSLSKTGYGKMGSTPAHRIAWKVTFGDIPDCLHVLHKCDNRACVNPAHLFLGTHQDNMRDMMAKGRQTRTIGEKNPRAKLTVDQVLAIRADVRMGTVIAKEYRVTPTTVCQIKKRKSWSHLSGGLGDV